MDKTVIIVDLKTADLETQDLFTEAQLKEFLCVIHRGEEQKQSQQYVGQQRARSKYTPAGYKVCWYHSLESFWVSVLMSICFWQPPPPRRIRAARDPAHGHPRQTERGGYYEV